MSYKPKRPGGVTVVAVILFVVGGWSLLAGGCGGGGMAIVAAIPEPPEAAGGKARPDDPLASLRFIVKEVPSYYGVMFTNIGVNMLFGIGQIVAGIGLLRLRPTARLMAILVSLGKLLFAFAGHAYAIFVVGPAQERFFQQNPQLPGGNFTGALTLVSLAITVGIQITLFIIIVSLISTQNAREAFAAAALPPTEEDEARGRRYDADES